jgi:hypothetical protein
MSAPSTATSSSCNLKISWSWRTDEAQVIGGSKRCGDYGLNAHPLYSNTQQKRLSRLRVVPTVIAATLKEKGKYNFEFYNVGQIPIFLGFCQLPMAGACFTVVAQVSAYPRSGDNRRRLDNLPQRVSKVFT